MIFPPSTQPSDSLVRQLVVYLVNWVFWIVPAIADTCSGDIGNDYHCEVTFISSIPIATAVALFLFSYSTPETGVEGWMCIVGGVAVYLICGIVYHLNNNKWGHYIKDRY